MREIRENSPLHGQGGHGDRRSVEPFVFVAVVRQARLFRFLLLLILFLLPVPVPAFPAFFAEILRRPEQQRRRRHRRRRCGHEHRFSLRLNASPIAATATAAAARFGGGRRHPVADDIRVRRLCRTKRLTIPRDSTEMWDDVRSAPGLGHCVGETAVRENPKGT